MTRCLGGSSLSKDKWQREAFGWCETVQRIGLQAGNNENVCLYFKNGGCCHGLKARICDIRPPKNVTDDDILQFTIQQSLNHTQPLDQSQDVDITEDELLQFAIEQSLNQN